MDKQEIKNKLLEVAQNAIDDLDVSKVDTSKDFVEEYHVDSVQLIQMIVEAEKTFDVSFDDTELALSEYDSFDALADKIEEKLK